MNTWYCTKLLVDLVNVDVKIEEEDKMLILLNSLPNEEYETFTLTSINGKQTINYSYVSAALVNYEVRRKDKQSSSNGTSAEALMTRGRGSNRKSKGKRQRLESRPGFRDMKKNQCAFCKEIGYWKIDCPKIKNKNKKESKTDKSRMGGQYSGQYFIGRWIKLGLIGILFLCYYSYRWLLRRCWVDIWNYHHVCPNRDWFSSFEKLDGCSVIMGDDHQCNMKDIRTVQTKMFDGKIRELKEVRYVSQLKRNLISVGALKLWVLWYLLEMMFSRWRKAQWWLWRASTKLISTIWKVV